MRIPKSIEDQIDVQISINDLRVRFNDGQTRDVAFVNGIFVNGERVDTPSMPMICAHRKVASYEEFDAELNRFANSTVAPTRELVMHDMVVVRAAARAGLIWMSAIMELQTSPKGPKKDILTDAAKNAITILGMSKGVDDLGNIEDCEGLSFELREAFERYLDNPYAWVSPTEKVDR